MNENITEDRFHELQYEGKNIEIKCSRKDIDFNMWQERINTRLENCEELDISPQEKEMEYAPELAFFANRGFNVTSNVNLTKNKKYKILSKKESNIFASVNSTYYKINDNNGNKIWINSEYFIPANPILTNQTDFLNEEVIDIRSVSKRFESKGLKINKEPIINKDLLSLSGLHESYGELKYHPNKNRYSECNDLWKHGKVIDEGNELLHDTQKCQDAVDKVFYNKIDKKQLEIISILQEKFPDYRISWKNDFIAVNETVTKIQKSNIELACNGLQPLFSKNQATKIVAKLVINKLKNLF